MGPILETLQALITWLVGGTLGVGETATVYPGVIQSFLTTITGNPLLMVFFVISLVGLGIGIIKRLTSAN